MKISDLSTYCLTLVIGLLTVTSVNSREFSGWGTTDTSTQEVHAHSQSLPFHYEQIQLLSLQSAFQQNHTGTSFFLPIEGRFEVWMQSRQAHSFSFLQDIRWVLEALLFPFHSFW